ncbi:MAG TPA: hypothetical protein PK861_04520, partial [Thermomonas sp.]|nr:hypothetical protein [Thermomonas sp.]
MATSAHFRGGRDTGGAGSGTGPGSDFVSALFASDRLDHIEAVAAQEAQSRFGLRHLRIETARDPALDADLQGATPISRLAARTGRLRSQAGQALTFALGDLPRAMLLPASTKNGSWIILNLLILPKLKGL